MRKFFKWFNPTTYSKKQTPTELPIQERDVKVLTGELIALQSNITKPINSYHYRLESFSNYRKSFTGSEGWVSLFKDPFEITDRQDKTVAGGISHDMNLHLPLKNSFITSSWGRAFYFYDSLSIAEKKREARRKNYSFKGNKVTIGVDSNLMNNVILTRYNKESPAIDKQPVHSDISEEGASFIIPQLGISNIEWSNIEFQFGNGWLSLSDGSVREIMSELSFRLSDKNYSLDPNRKKQELAFFLRYTQGILTQEMVDDILR